MKTNNIRKLVAISLLVALLLIFNFTSLGYIRIGIASITLMCLPVIIGTLTLGFLPGLILGLVFALTSVYQLITQPFGMFGLLYAQFGLWPLVTVLVIPRLLIPVLTGLAGKILEEARPVVRYGVSAVVGSLTNTLFVLGGTYMIFGKALTAFFQENMGTSVIGGMSSIVLSNGIAEAAFAMLACTAVLLALKKAMPSMFFAEKATK